MKRILGTLLLAGSLTLAGLAISSAAEEKKADEKAKSMTITGEIVDTACYLAQGAMGAKHKECAVRCIAGGSPMALLTAKGNLYLLTPPHGNADAFNKAKEWAGERVEVTGEVHERNGMKSMEVASAKPAVAESTSAQSK